MDEKLAKKIGEIKAFTLLGIGLFEKSKDALTQVFGVDDMNQISHDLEVQLQSINEEISNSEFLEIIEEKTQKTKEKVSGMQSTYIGDKWNDSTELCEWLGFFEGAALVHFSLVSALSINKNLESLTHFANEGAIFHHNLLEKVKESIKKLASNDLTTNDLI